MSEIQMRDQRAEELYDTFIATISRFQALLEKLALANYDQRMLRDELMLCADATIEHAKMAEQFNARLSGKFYELALDMMKLSLDIIKDQHAPRIEEALMARYSRELTGFSAQ